MTQPSESLPVRGAFAIGGGLLFALSLLYFAWQYLAGFDAPAEPHATVSALTVNIALFTAFALHHSIFARTPLKALVSRAAGPSLERSVYVWVASGLFLIVCALWQPVPGQIWQLSAPWSWAFRAIQAAGVALTIAAARRLDVFELAGISSARGRPPRRQILDDTGPYGLVRHPIYFAWLLLVWAAPDMNATRFTFAAISSAYLLVAIPLEERDLRRHFGSGYDQYATRVRRRLLPGVY